MLEEGATLIANDGSCYRILSQIGQGGSARVYAAARGPLTLAIKILRADLSQDPEMKELLVAEAGLLQTLAHPGLPSFVARGEYEGRPWIAMSWFLGCNLENLLGTYTLEADFVIDVGLQICEALGYLHDRNLRHGDVKPSNVIVGDSVGLVDLGITARGTSFVYGTPHYMAPEVIRGDAAGPWSDVYALGALLYNAVTGDTVFTGERALEVCDQHLHSRPVSPAHRSHNPVPRELDALILRCLEKDPDDRPTVYEIAVTLGRARSASLRRVA